MKNLILFLAASCLLFIQANPALASSDAPSVAVAADVTQQVGLPGNLTADDFLNLKPKEIAERSGKKMNFFQRLALKVVQKKVKKKMAKADRNGKTKASGLGIATLIVGSIAMLGALTMWFIPGMFAVALLFGLIGTILGAVARSNGDRDGATTAGFIMSLISGGLALLLLIVALAFLNSFF
ncbi:MAG: hypothetical protein AB8F95_01615 [Bacteroidia bacterium]